MGKDRDEAVLRAIRALVRQERAARLRSVGEEQDGCEPLVLFGWGRAQRNRLLGEVQRLRFGGGIGLGFCLGCGGMAGLDDAVRASTGVPVVDGVTAAVKLAESLVALGLSTSKVRTYAPPRPKRIEGWPLTPPRRRLR